MSNQLPSGKSGSTLIRIRIWANLPNVCTKKPHRGMELQRGFFSNGLTEFRSLNAVVSKDLADKPVGDRSHPKRPASPDRMEGVGMEEPNHL